MCGGTKAKEQGSIADHGLSPRVRGNHRGRRSRHPREGLSPRVRGNLFEAGVDVVVERSIPACAGEPLRGRGRRSRRTVYPRVCGGTQPSELDLRMAMGLSPRVRGNPIEAGSAGGLVRSIPACAGEPRGSCPTADRFGVYPRVCGGTVTKNGSPTISEGSIPACAGEPRRSARRSISPAVYPRVCGGTMVEIPRVGEALGLSPRVRGNPPLVVAATGERRSIPACAGEPGSTP